MPSRLEVREVNLRVARWGRWGGPEWVVVGTGERGLGDVVELGCRYMKRDDSPQAEARGGAVCRRGGAIDEFAVLSVGGVEGGSGRRR